ncbi:MAG: CBS domain-containing protein, partial [Candidatus Altiarchaeota archaeon]|nr:CBS domain-containing protein [Candidatus Altiarchaeota archaeon]
MSRNPNRFHDTKAGLDRGPKEIKTRIVKKTGDALKIGTRKVIYTHPQNTIKNAASLMRENDVRRLPLLQAGVERLEGLVTAIDIIDFLGGGEKYHIIEKDFDGNFLSAINCPIRKISRQSQYITTLAQAQDIAEIMVNKRSSIIPIVEDEAELKVVAVVTERDMLPNTFEYGVDVADVMSRKVITASKGMTLGDVSKAMVRNQIRRLPVIEEDSVVGVITSLDLLGYLEKGEYKGVYAEENLETRVEELMEPEVISLRPDDDLGDMVKLVKETGIGG